MGEWGTVTLMELISAGDAELQTGPFGTVLKASEYSAIGVPVVSVGEIETGHIKLSGRTPRVSETTKQRLPQFVLREGDIVFGRKGGIDRNARIGPRECGWFLGSDGIRLRLSERIDSTFVSYQLRLRAIGKWLLGNSAASIMPSLNEGMLKRLPLRVPKLGEQRGIADVLAALDAKIDLNNRINAELEALAKTLYDYWFVQFDFPDANGRPYRSSGGAMVWNDTLKREIPAGWDVGTLWDIATYTNGLAMQKYRPSGDDYLPVIKIREMSEGFTPQTERADPNVPSRIVVSDGDVLFSWSATLVVQLWSGGPGALNQHIFKVTSETYPRCFRYFELSTYLHHFRMMAERRKTTMGHITLDHLRQATICLPPIQLIQELSLMVEPMLDHQVMLNQQNRELTQLRDWLLPLLMNGQVRVG